MHLAKTSLVSTFVAIPIGFAIALQQHGHAVMGILILTPVAIAASAGVLAIASLVRRERPRWLSVVALAVALLPVTALAMLVAYERFDDHSYQNSASPPAPAVGRGGGAAS